MAYAALPDHRMAYDNDGTLVYQGQGTTGAVVALSSAQMQELQDTDQVNSITSDSVDADGGSNGRVWFFFPEQREVTGMFAHGDSGRAVSALQGSNDTGNGVDGTWETASVSGGYPTRTHDFSWRDSIRAVSFTGPKQSLRATYHGSHSAVDKGYLQTFHLYGEAAAGQMAHDLVYINHDDTPGVAFTASEDFGDQPLGTSVVRQFRIKNTSATKTATTINIQCNDADFVIAENPAGPWVVTINLASLGPGAESPTYYVRSTTPAPGAALIPRFARIITICDAGFFG